MIGKKGPTGSLSGRWQQSMTNDNYNWISSVGISVGISIAEFTDAMRRMNEAMTSTTEGMWGSMTVTTPKPPEPTKPPANALRTLLIRD